MTLPNDYPRPGPLGQTDPARWRLDSSNDRHVWHYARPQGSTGYEEVWGPDDAGFRAQEQNDETQYWLGHELPAGPGLTDARGDPYEAAKNGFEFYKRIQSIDGHWAGGEKSVGGLRLRSIGSNKSLRGECGPGHQAD